MLGRAHSSTRDHRRDLYFTRAEAQYKTNLYISLFTELVYSYITRHQPPYCMQLNTKYIYKKKEKKKSLPWRSFRCQLTVSQSFASVIGSGGTLIVSTLISCYKSKNGVRSRAVPNRKDGTREMTRGTPPRRPFRAHTVRALLVQTVTLKHKPLFTGAVLYFLEIARAEGEI